VLPATILIGNIQEVVDTTVQGRDRIAENLATRCFI